MELVLLTGVIWLLLVFTLAIAAPRLRLGQPAAGLGLVAVAVVFVTNGQIGAGFPASNESKPRAVLANALQVPDIPTEVNALLNANGYEVTYAYEQELLRSSIHTRRHVPVVDELRRLIPGATVVHDPGLSADLVVRVGLAASVEGRSVILFGPADQLEQLSQLLAHYGIEATLRPSLARPRTLLLTGSEAHIASGLELVHLFRRLLSCGMVPKRAEATPDLEGHDAGVWVGGDMMRSGSSCSFPWSSSS